MSTPTIHCQKHGATKPHMICQHLQTKEGLGYYRVEVAPDRDDCETALCEACDALVWEEDGWTDRVYAFAGWKLYCEACYCSVLEHHRLLGTGKLGTETEATGT